ncbi:hypothetical protein AAES_50359 [Amazona aestiva]|uniref:Uncharacterized protein n=1 Tax=Amazona aestiva TaxID=12930 RepID=A0A0Q3UTZ7_AMAAE|nr:hypothetical protein AAES_50359 [Amazona aestiva]
MPVLAAQARIAFDAEVGRCERVGGVYTGESGKKLQENLECKAVAASKQYAYPGMKHRNASGVKEPMTPSSVSLGLKDASSALW